MQAGQTPVGELLQAFHSQLTAGCPRAIIELWITQALSRDTTSSTPRAVEIDFVPSIAPESNRLAGPGSSAWWTAKWARGLDQARLKHGEHGFDG